ncbi:MAG: cytochrome C oxidase subunit IV family protein [Anaerolineales bacterium]|nr:cytochrome C oxidase subunit IV family protein [Anaerolineales bacterium]MCB9433170.1 cytochrome C oxidase subunit IV family protein [Ardenticatenaceae bacterium]
MSSENKAAAMRTGYTVFIALAILTIGEYIVAQASIPLTVPLFIIALIKAALIVNFFMHVYRLWREESH